MFNLIVELDAGLQGLHILIVELGALNVVGLINSEIRKPIFFNKIIDIIIYLSYSNYKVNQ